MKENVAIVSGVTLDYVYCVSTCVSSGKNIEQSAYYMMIELNFKMLIRLPICHEFEEIYKSTKVFGTNSVLAYGRTCKPYSPLMVGSTYYVYASAEHLANKEYVCRSAYSCFYDGINAVYII